MAAGAANSSPEDQPPPSPPTLALIPFVSRSEISYFSSTSTSLLSPSCDSVAPITSAVHHPLRQSAPDLTGPLCFTPDPLSLSTLFYLRIPPSTLFPPIPQISLPRFLTVSSDVPSSASSHIASSLDVHPAFLDEGPSSKFAHNRIRLVRCGCSKVRGRGQIRVREFVVLFPSGENNDQVGYLRLRVRGNGEIEVVSDDNGEPFLSRKRLYQPIVRLVVSEVRGRSDLFGYVVACTMYSAHWFCVKRNRAAGDGFVSLNYLGSSEFRSDVSGCCWSSREPESCVVLLGNGSLCLYDMKPLESTDDRSAEVPLDNIKGTRLRVAWGASGGVGSAKWLGCEFAWYFKMVVAARSDAVFLVDFTSGKCVVSCVADIKMSGAYASAETDRFVAFTKAGPDGFHFVVATNKMLILFSLKQPKVPLLQWYHGLDRPCYIDVFRLSQLRSNCGKDPYAWASNSGFCILLGSFWTSDFCLFCYGPAGHDPSDPLFEWVQSYGLCLSGRECRSGDSLLKEYVSRNSLPEWVEWQRKTDFVLGFGILCNDFLPICSDGEHGGFTMIRLMSSGKLECQRFSASWYFGIHALDAAPFPSRDDSLHTENEEKYKFPRKFQYVKIDYLSAYFDCRLASVLKSKVVRSVKDYDLDGFFTPTLRETLSEKLKGIGLPLGSTSDVASLFDDIDAPTNVSEIISRKNWAGAGFPVELLMLAFSHYSEFLQVLFNQKEASLEFLAVPEQPQLPPFILREPSSCSNKWSGRVSRGDALVGPVTPGPFLSILHILRAGTVDGGENSRFGLSPEVELDRDCIEVMEVATELTMSESNCGVDCEAAVSLADDAENLTDSGHKKYLLYEIGSFKPHVHPLCSNIVSKVCIQDEASGGSIGATGLDFFRDSCPIKLMFNDDHLDFGTTEQTAYKIMKRQFLKYQEASEFYGDFLSDFNFNKPKPATS